MKAEDFFRLVLKQVMNRDETEIDKHFKEFRKSHHQFPEILESLEKEITNRDGKVIDNTEAALLINELKQGKSDYPEEFWKPFIWFLVKSTDLYVREIKTQIRFANFCFEQYLMAKKNSDVEIIFLHIHHFVVHAANIDRLLDKLSNPPKSFQARFFKEAIDLSDIDLKPFRSMRNHLEHFEERLNAWGYLHLGEPIFDMNLVSTQTEGVMEEKCLRLLIYDKDEFVVLGERFDLVELHRQISVLEEKICKIEYWGVG